MNIELTKSQRLLLCGGLIGLASLMLQACETVMKENEDVREKICGNWQSAEVGPDILVYREGEHYKVTLFRRSGVRRRLKPETYLLQREENGNLYMNTGGGERQPLHEHGLPHRRGVQRGNGRADLLAERRLYPGEHG